MFRSFLDTLLDFLFPHTGLRKKVETIKSEEFLGRVQYTTQTPEEIHAPLKYRDPLVRAAIWALKYKQSKNAARLLANALYDTLLEELSDAKLFAPDATVLLVPIPLSTARLKQRGFNQSELLARELLAIAENTPIQYEPGLLRRVKDTPSQTQTRNRRERFENIKNAFVVPKPKLVKGKIVVVLDDVTTTGATLSESANILRVAGAEHVVCLAATH